MAFIHYICDIELSRVTGYNCIIKSKHVYVSHYIQLKYVWAFEMIYDGNWVSYDRKFNSC